MEPLPSPRVAVHDEMHGALQKKRHSKHVTKLIENREFAVVLLPIFMAASPREIGAICVK